MRKYTSVLFAFVLFITLLGFNANSASATNCAPGDLFSSATGQPCSGTKMEVNGGADSSEDGDVLKFNDLLKNGFAIGSKGDDVRMLQQFLRDLGYYLGKIDGNYGKRTARAVKDFQDDNDITAPPVPPIVIEDPCKIRPDLSFCKPQSSYPVISGISGPQSLKINEAGTWVVKASDSSGRSLAYSVVWGDEYYKTTQNSLSAPMAREQVATFTHSYMQAGTYTPIFTVTNDAGQITQASLSVSVGGTNYYSSVSVLSPNGGEYLQKGATQTITWQDNSTTTCPKGANCISVKLYDIKLVAYNPSCTSQACPDYHITSRIIASSVYGYSYDWSIPNCTTSKPCSSNFEVGTGAYTIQICQSGTAICDSSDSYFKVIPAILTNNPPKIVSSTIQATILAEQSASFNFTATDLENDDLSWSVDWGDYAKYSGIYGTSGGSTGIACPVGGVKQNGTNYNFSPSYTWASVGNYEVTVSVSDCRGGTDSLKFRVNVSSTKVYNLSIDTPSPLPNATVGTSYKVAIDASGGTLPVGYNSNGYNWSVSSGYLPYGLSLSSSDHGMVITGTPTMYGIFHFSLTASFNSSITGFQSATKEFILAVDSGTTKRSF
ncbi:hypothetical protein A2W67_02125 [Candidatus Nomurabacteria bacterium RIFCSPLOWO2_02_40_28]|uniref:Peptidoglycan-binding domain 1 protein n=2 Tax=Candidatus Nomuraibacteriota TaxID=1752729 RepID=A0A837HT07_9BACT|nr:MAG: Peptidoglycan-binding domain 1 protein [Candidatus Nomurabacteria bacterium GW2011_GWD2_39_12]KKR20150.1 MAG: Peptidoglycan-binding domain 1 protein [Candidatus Nomurabacteria bacterium GW2011_GWC2_39_41]KKR36491.1 MAG: Peptidoglycan-binding domain 1 protein [Candidatus Nomurabacteria bacterium GW2011_GWE2_40_10]KKR37994.1 MAG: Peptidoglycan-binding domain 1 protein [Candidatus Nomurabacteria bacterium GW2011_GWB1_40_11]KKR39500.1 MAG: Peptidoglycan-binding domain 1 protein [Parcubacter